MKRVLFTLGFLGAWFAVSPLFSSDPKAPQASSCPSCVASKPNGSPTQGRSLLHNQDGEEKQITVTCVPNSSGQLTIPARALASSELAVDRNA